MTSPTWIVDEVNQLVASAKGVVGKADFALLAERYNSLCARIVKALAETGDEGMQQLGTSLGLTTAALPTFRILDQIENLRQTTGLVVQAFLASNSPARCTIAEPAPDFVVYAALQKEVKFVVQSLKDYQNGIEFGHSLIYGQGRLKSGKAVAVVTGAPNSMGLVETAMNCARLLTRWKPQVFVLVGICAGVRERGVAIGHVVAPSMCFHYQFGKYNKGKLIRELKSEVVDELMLRKFNDLASTKTLALLRTAAEEAGVEVTAAAIRCWNEPMASADLVVQDETKLSEVTQVDRKTGAVDMESYAFVRAARQASVPAIVVKGVADLADENKDDSAHNYASYISGCLVHAFLETL